MGLTANVPVPQHHQMPVPRIEEGIEKVIHPVLGDTDHQEIASLRFMSAVKTNTGT